ncbi:MAG TPA: hypothetical protein VK859_06605, partial [bacterium]|nr:hypothetical protein [bacterium]
MKFKAKAAPKASSKVPPKRKKNSYAEVAKLIKSHKSFLLTTHVNPDGDGLGAESALFTALRKLGKKVRVVN